MSEPIFEVSAKLLHAALPFAAKGDIRYYLNGIHIRQSGNGHTCIIEATNGHMMAILHDDNGALTGDPASVILCRDVVAKLPKTGKILIYEDGSVTQFDPLKGSSNIRYEKATIDGKFPNSAKVIPAADRLKPGVQTSTWNRQYFKDAWALFPKLYKWDEVQVFQADDNGPVLLTNSAHDAIVIIMPMRGDPCYVSPAWCPVQKQGDGEATA